LDRNKGILVGLTYSEMANKLYNINNGFNGVVIDNITATLTPKNYTIGCLILGL
jgi:hypothetical protein